MHFFEQNDIKKQFFYVILKKNDNFTDKLCDLVYNLSKSNIKLRIPALLKLLCKRIYHIGPLMAITNLHHEHYLIHYHNTLEFHIRHILHL